MFSAVFGEQPPQVGLMLGSNDFSSGEHLEIGFTLVFRISVRLLKHNSCHALILDGWDTSSRHEEL
jgi:hypothetical protein